MAKRKRRTRQKPSESTPAQFNNPFGGLSGFPAGPGDSSEADKPAPSRPSTPPITGLAASGKLVLQRERKGRGGKTVTRVSGLAPGLLKDTARRIKSALGCGATVEGGDLIVLGDLADRVAGWLGKEGAQRVVVSGRSGKK